MRLSVLIAEDHNGKWDCIALPDKSIDDQKKLFKQVILDHGKLESGKKGKPVQLRRLMRFEKFIKRASFDKQVVVPVSQPEVVA